MEDLGKYGEQIFHSIVQSINSAVILHDRELKVIFVNDVFEVIFGIRKKDAVGRSPMEFLPEFDANHKEAIVERLKKTLRSGKKSEYHEFPYYSPAGKFRYLLALSIPVFNSDKEITHVMSLIHDITRRKELEQDAVKAAKLSSVADMAYTLAHEINNPLTGIRLGLSTLSKSLEKEENIQILENVMKDLDRIRDIVNRFLRAKKEGSKQRREKISVMDEIIEEVLFHLSTQLQSQNISVLNKLIDEESYVSIDRDGMYRVMLNVLLNAIQAIPKDGSIVISDGISVQEKEKGAEEYLCISISDTGVGIDKEECREVFEPYYSSKSKGSGLGLTICKDIVERHQGFMEFDSNKGKGTKVSIYLPIAK